MEVGTTRVIGAPAGSARASAAAPVAFVSMVREPRQRRLAPSPPRAIRMGRASGRQPRRRVRRVSARAAQARGAPKDDPHERRDFRVALRKRLVGDSCVVRTGLDVSDQTDALITASAPQLRGAA